MRLQFNLLAERKINRLTREVVAKNKKSGVPDGISWTAGLQRDILRRLTSQKELRDKLR